MSIFETLNATAEAWELRYTDKFLVDLVGRMNELADTSGLTRREIAERAGWKEPYLSRVLTGQQNLTLRSLAKFEEAVGSDVLVVTGAKAKQPAGRRLRFHSEATAVQHFAVAPKARPVEQTDEFERIAKNDYSYALGLELA